MPYVNAMPISAMLRRLANASALDAAKAQSRAHALESDHQLNDALFWEGTYVGMTAVIETLRTAAALAEVEERAGKVVDK